MRLFKRPRRDRGATPGASFIYSFYDQLDSKDSGWTFAAHIRLSWSHGEPWSAPGVSHLLAAQRVREIAEREATKVSVLRPDAAQQDVNCALAATFPAMAGSISINYARASLSVDDQTLQSVQRWKQEQEEFELQRLRQERLSAQMRFMRDEVLRDPAAARVYWLVENISSSDVLSQQGQLDDLVRQVNLWQPENRWTVVAQLLHEFIGQLSSSSRQDQFLRLLAGVFHEFGGTELAERLMYETSAETIGADRSVRGMAADDRGPV